MKNDPHEPALWRTCRIIANKRRLLLFQHLIDRGECCNVELSNQLNFSESQISASLKSLASHGLIQQYRKKNRLLNIARAEPYSAQAVALTNALRKCFQQQVPIQTQYKQATGFTHSRRLDIAKNLSPKGINIETLSEQLHIPAPSLLRHANKLAERGYLMFDNNQLTLTRPTDPLSRALLKIIQTERQCAS